MSWVRCLNRVFGFGSGRPMPMKIASAPSDRSLLMVKSALLKDLPVSILTPKSFTSWISKLTTDIGNRYWGISEVLEV